MRSSRARREDHLMPKSAAWSKDRISTLTAHWIDGLSASQIADRLGGVSRNAVIGKLHRLGLCGDGRPPMPKPQAAAGAARRPDQTRPAPARLPAKTAPSIPSPPEGPGLVADLIGLGAHACRWPIGDPKAAGFTFCGRRADGRYRHGHEQRAVRPGSASRAARDPIIRLALAGRI